MADRVPDSTDILDEVKAAEVAHTASSLEVRLGMEIVELRSRNQLLEQHVKRLEEELASMVEYRRIEQDAMREEREIEREQKRWEAFHAI